MKTWHFYFPMNVKRLQPLFRVVKICFPNRTGMNFYMKVHALTHRNHTAATINLWLTPRNLEPYGHGILKRKKEGGKCPEHMLSQGSLEQRDTLLFTSLITFPECCIYWSRAHKLGLSQLYRRHINVTAVLFNSRGLISPLRSR